MTADEWDASTDLEAMLAVRPVRGRKRQLRLFAVGCCRQLARWVSDDRLWDALAAAERYADGLLKDAGLDRWTAIANGSWTATENGPRKRNHRARIATHRAIAYTTLANRYARMGMGSVGGVPLRILQADAADFGAKAVEPLRTLFPHLLREVIGNPFRLVKFTTKWRSDPAVALAKTMYETRVFNAMPVLADALEDAGCDHPDVLTHCRQPDAIHVRGCWVVDGVLGKK